MNRRVRWLARTGRALGSPDEGGGVAGPRRELDGARDPQGWPEAVPGGVPEGVGDGTRTSREREQALHALRMARARRLAIALGASGQVARSR